MSEWLALTLATVATCTVVLVVAVLRQRRVGEDDPSETPDVIEYIIMMIGVVYAIVLGLAIAGVWEARGEAEEWVRQEAQALHEVSERALALPPAVRDEVRDQVDAYVTHTVDVEWTRMVDEGELSERGEGLLSELRSTVTRWEPETVRGAQSYQGLVEQLAAADEARTGRGESAGSTMPAVVWVGLIAGGAMVVGMVFALQIQRSARELLLAGLFSALFAFLLFLIWHFDAPYARGLSDSTETFRTLFPHVLGEH